MVMVHEDIVKVVQQISEKVEWPEPQVKQFDGFDLIFHGNAPNMAAFGDDQNVLKYTPVFLEAISYESTLGIVAHEMAHLVYNHVGERRARWDETLFSNDLQYQQEFQADDFAKALGYGEELAFGLEELVEYLATVESKFRGSRFRDVQNHFMNVSSNTHPPMVERIARLTKD